MSVKKRSPLAVAAAPSLRTPFFIVPPSRFRSPARNSEPFDRANFHMQCNYALALDLGPFSDSIGAEISGLLGYDTLSAFCFVLDYREGLVRFI